MTLQPNVEKILNGGEEAGNQGDEESIVVTDEEDPIEIDKNIV